MLTIKQAAKMFGYSVRHLSRLCDEGKIKAERFGRMYVVDEESARAYAANPPKPGPRNDEYGWPSV
jgi:excisionase family DNA binding protein